MKRCKRFAERFRFERTVFLLGVVLGGLGLVPSAVHGAAQIAVGSTSGKRGWLVTVDVTLNPGSAPVSATQNDIGFDSVNTPIAEKADGTPDCTVNPSLGKNASFVFRPPGCVGTECTTVRAAVYKLEEASPSIPNGSLYTCKVQISTTAPLGTYQLLNSEAYSSKANGADVSTTAANGQVTIESGGQCAIQPNPRPSAFCFTLVLALLVAVRPRRRPSGLRAWLLPAGLRAASLAAAVATVLGLSVAANATTTVPVRMQGSWTSADGTSGGTWAGELGQDATGGLSGHLTLTDLVAFERANATGFVTAGRVVLILWDVDTRRKLADLTATLGGEALTGNLTTIGGFTASVAGQWLPKAVGPVVSQAVLDGLAAGRPQEVIVKFEWKGIEAQAAAMRAQRRVAVDDAAVRDFKASQFAAVKADVLSQLPASEVVVLKDYSHLPMLFVRVESAEALAKLLAQPGVTRVREDVMYEVQLAESLPLVGQPAALAAGFGGAGTTVAVLDTGANSFWFPTLGTCHNPQDPLGDPFAYLGTPGCKIAVVEDFTNTRITPGLDRNTHGSHVASTVLGVAPDARIAALAVCNDQGGCDFANWVAPALNWVIANRDAYNIVAFNMSLGKNFPLPQYPTLCPDDSDILEEVALTRAAGIVPVISSGNAAQPYAISTPACTPGAVRVGATYDADVGIQQFELICTDPTTAPDQVACFSNSAAVLTLLAPGCVITADGDSQCGTSMAAPHVAGAAALLRTPPFANDAVDCTVARLVKSGVDVVDGRNGMHFPRIDMAAAVETRPNSVGDCAMTDGYVRIFEIMRGVAVLLGTKPLSYCAEMDANGDGAVTVDELITAVQIMMTGCAAGESGNR